MICYKDRTYCSAMCKNMLCDRNQQHALNELANIPEDKRLPLAISNLKDSPYCIGYQPLSEMFGIKEVYE